MTGERPPYLPGDPMPEAEIERMIRVDHAGEYGAVRIYDGQLAVMRHGRARDEIRRMAEHEARHLASFNELVRTGRVRPTLLQPLWHMAGYALGMATALLGEEAAMACTVAVEEVIDEHYQDQAERLGDRDPALKIGAGLFRQDHFFSISFSFGRATGCRHNETNNDEDGTKAVIHMNPLDVRQSGTRRVGKNNPWTARAIFRGRNFGNDFAIATGRFVSC